MISCDVSTFQLFKEEQRVFYSSMEESLIENAVDLFQPENKNIHQIIEHFDGVVDSIFSDNTFNRGRFVVLGRFCDRIIERSKHIDTTLLTKLLKDRINSLRARWYDVEGIHHWC